MTSAPGGPRSVGAARYAGAAPILCVIAAEAAWRRLDLRLPAADPAPLGWVPELYWALGDAATRASATLSSWVVPGGWQAWVAAAAMRLAGRSTEAYDIAALLAWALLVTAGASVAGSFAGREPGRPRSTPAAIAAVLLPTLPWITLASRDGGASVAEAVPPTVLLALALRDPALARLPILIGVGFAGALTVATGAIGWLWAAPVLVLLVLEALRRARAPAEPVRPARLVFVLATWLLAAATAPTVRAATLDSRQREATAPLTDRAADLLALLGLPAVIALAAAALLGLAARAPHPAPDAPIARVSRLLTLGPPLALVAWAAAPLAAGALLRPERAVPAGVALVALAAAPLARRAWALPAATVAWLAFVGSSFTSALPAPHTVASLAHGPYRPLRVDLGATLGALLDATCASDDWASCRVVVDHGLAGPNASDPGRLVRFLLAEDRIALATVYDAPRARLDELGVDALLTFECGAYDDRNRLRNPDATLRVVQLAGTFDLAPVWSGWLGGDHCRAHWLVPGGHVASPDRLPPTAVGPTWTPLSALAALDAFYARHPSHRGRQGRGSARRTEPGPLPTPSHDSATPPPGWSLEGAAARRAAAR